ncbi:MAG: SDR family oxidoreductase [Deltaproteobacteria bacterium]|nr:SDR family oxidoreductase [Deltaproteobacteria bacterium]
MRVLIPGVAGGLARQVAARLLRLGHEVIGIDPRRFWDVPDGLELYPVDVRKRAAEDVFRKRRPDAVVHMATVTSLQVQGDERDRINLGGTRAVFDHCRTYGVKQVVFVGRHTFYGAAPDAALYHTEEEPPLALASFPALADLVAADLYAATSLWRDPSMRTSVLRMVYTLGPALHGTLGAFLRGRVVPIVLGYDPLFQFLHEQDAVSAIVLALEKQLRGLYNVAGLQPLPLSLIIRESGRTALPLPEFLLERVLGHGGLPGLPPGALSHLKFPIVVDGRRFREETGFAPTRDEVQTLHDIQLPR